MTKLNSFNSHLTLGSFIVQIHFQFFINFYLNHYSLLFIIISFGMASFYNEICNLIIRPQRCIYENSSLGPQTFGGRDDQFVREDFQITNERNMVIQCSFWCNQENVNREGIPVVVYCAGNCGSRCDALDAVQSLLPLGISVFGFDFCGSGLSDGEYVSLGYFEQIDLKAVIQYLRSKKKVGKIGLWGRSMGSATSIMFASQFPDEISGIIADSPFASLEKVMIDLVRTNTKFPTKMIKVGINVIRKSIQKKAKFDIYHNAPVQYAPNAKAPIIFFGAYGDDFVRLSHSEDLFQVYGGDKQIIRIEGDHNSERPSYFYDIVASFFYNVLISGTDEENPNVARDILESKRHNFSAYYWAAHRNHASNTKSRSSSTTSATRNENILTHKRHHSFDESIGNDKEQSKTKYSVHDTNSNPSSFILSMLSSIQEELTICDDECDRIELMKQMEEYKKKAQELGISINS